MLFREKRSKRFHLSIPIKLIVSVRKRHISPIPTPTQQIPTPNMDAMHALDLLTEDGWREVFKKVWSPEDLKSCSETCTTFEGILEGKKTTWMFHSILPHVLAYLSVDTSDWRRGTLWNAVYNCRRVCKAWRQTVDHYLERHNSYFEGLSKPTSDVYLLGPGGDNDIEAFSNMFEDFAGNPFIGRYLEFYHVGLLDHRQRDPGQDHLYQDMVDAYIVNQRQILNRFGNELWSISIKITMMWSLSLCKNIQILLGMLPNLKSLQISPIFENEDTEMNQLPAFLAANPLPDHPNLENLALSWLNSDMARPLLEKYGPQLKRLQWCFPKSFVDRVTRFQCLEELEIWTSDTNESLNSLRQLRAPLTSLHVHVKINGDTWPIHELIRDVLHLPLTDLWITSWNQFEGKLDSFPASLRHGSIRRVKITCHCHTYATRSLSFNFLRCFPILEEVHYLECLYVGAPQHGQESSLLIVTTEEDIYESPVWEVIPSLRLISVDTVGARRPKEYRRSTFEMRRLEKTKEI